AAQALDDIRALQIGGVMGMDLGGSVDDFGDASRQLAGRQLALSAEDEDFPAQPGDDQRLDEQDHQRDAAEPEALLQHEKERRQGIAAQESGLNEGVADESAERLHLVLDHRGDLGLLDLAEVRLRKAQHPVEQIEAQAPQHALAQAALRRIDVDLEPVVDDDEDEEQHADRDQIGNPIQLESIEDVQGAATKESRERNFQAQKAGDPLGMGGQLLNGVDDRPRQVERDVIESKRERHHQQDQALLS